MKKGWIKHNVCCVDGCDTVEIHSDGYCNKHYRQIHKHGKILEMSTSQANVHKGKQKGDYTSVYKGVNWDPNRGMWRSRIGCNGVGHWLGRHNSEVGAAAAYNQAAIFYFGEHATLNNI